MQKELLTNSPEETEAFGAEVGRYISEDESAPKFIALYGDLGVGKTAFVRGLASVIAPDSIVRSPTFALVNEYRAKNSSLFHFDMYRINDEDELYRKIRKNSTHGACKQTSDNVGRVVYHKIIARCHHQRHVRYGSKKDPPTPFAEAKSDSRSHSRRNVSRGEGIFTYRVRADVLPPLVKLGNSALKGSGTGNDLLDRKISDDSPKAYGKHH